MNTWMATRMATRMIMMPREMTELAWLHVDCVMTSHIVSDWQTNSENIFVLEFMLQTATFASTCIGDLLASWSWLYSKFHSSIQITIRITPWSDRGAIISNSSALVRIDACLTRARTQEHSICRYQVALSLCLVWVIINHPYATFILSCNFNLTHQFCIPLTLNFSSYLTRVNKV